MRSVPTNPRRWRSSYSRSAHRGPVGSEHPDVVTRRMILTLAAALTGAAACSTTPPSAAPGADASGQAPPPGSPGAQRYTYGDHPSQYAELSVPAGTGPVPVVVILHGGFWLTQYDADLGRPLAADLVPRGWATLNVEYRRVGRSRTAGGGGWPTTMTDVATAVDRLATEGERLAPGRLDLDRVVVLGHSAGGHLAGWLGGRPTLPSGTPGADPVVRVSGVVAQAGVMDLVGAAEEGVGGQAVPGLMGGGPGRLPEAYALASPLARLPFGIPSICVHGRADSIVPISQSERFVAAATQAGDPSELYAFDGDHFDPITVGTTGWTRCIEALTKLLA